MNNFKKFASFMVVLLIILVLAACSAGDKDVKEDSENLNNSSGESELNIALSVVPPTLDFQFSTAAVTRQIGWHIYETLFTYDEDQYIANLLAEDYEISDDGKTTTINIREGVKFHNGKEMTAEDVVSSLERWSELSSIASVIFEDVTSLKATDQYTVEIKTKAPSSVLLPSLTSPIQAAVIMPKEIIESVNEGEEVTEYIGTGPFKYEEWRQDQYVKLVKFDDYDSVSSPVSGLSGKKEALVDRIYFHFATDTAARVAGLQSGDYDFADGIPIDNYETLKSDSNINLEVVKPDKMLWAFMNNKSGVFTNEKIREAVYTGLNLEEIMTVAASSPEFYRIDPGIMFEEQGAWYSEAGASRHNQNDQEKAKQLLEEAGYDNEPITILSSEEYKFLY